MVRQIDVDITGFPEDISVDFTQQDVNFFSGGSSSGPMPDGGSSTPSKLFDEISDFAMKLIHRNISPDTPEADRLTVESIKELYRSTYPEYELHFEVSEHERTHPNH